MFILACLRPFEFKTKSPTKRFVALVAVTGTSMVVIFFKLNSLDLVPVVIQVINKHLKKSDASSSMMLYLVTACALYLVQFTLTITAMWTILVQTRKLMVLQGKPVGMFLDQR